MIATTSTLLLLATLTSAREESLLRGNRALVVEGEIPGGMPGFVTTMTDIRLNEMECGEYEPYDGSIVCVFRSKPPENLNSRKVIGDCLYKAELGTSYCVSIGFNRTNFADVPAVPLLVTTPPATVIPPLTVTPPATVNPPATVTPPVISNPNPLSPGCPSTRPVTSVACAQHILPGNFFIMCEWEDAFQCKCELNNDATVTELWDCFPKKDVSTVRPGSGVPGGVAFTPNSFSTTTETEKWIPQIENDPSCPATQPDDGMPCSLHTRCTYLTGINNDAVNCDCGGDRTLVCRKALNPIFGRDIP